MEFAHLLNNSLQLPSSNIENTPETLNVQRNSTGSCDDCSYSDHLCEENFMDDGNESCNELFTTPLAKFVIETDTSRGTDKSGISLMDIEQELQEIIENVNRGLPYDEKRLDQLIALQNEHPEHQARQLQELQDWTNRVEDYLAECLVKMRTFVPVNIACRSKDQLLEENKDLGVDVIRRLHEKKCLWLCRLSASDIDRLHEIELRDRYNPTAENLDIVELSAVYAAFPEHFSSDPSGKKLELKLAIMQLLQRLLKQKENDELPPHKLRNPVYGNEEYGPVEDITSTYTTRVVSGISIDEYKGLVAPRRSFGEVCGKHSILSTRKTNAERKYANVFAQYSGPDLVHAGWLKKETGKVFSVYQSRYCVLTLSDKMLRYFIREDDIDTQGTCDLSLITVVLPSNASQNCGTSSPSVKNQMVAGSETRFQLSNGSKKTWTFQANSVEDRDTWLGHLEFVMRAAPDTAKVSISNDSSKFSGRLSFGSPGMNSPTTRSIK